MLLSIQFLQYADRQTEQTNGQTNHSTPLYLCACWVINIDLEGEELLSCLTVVHFQYFHPCTFCSLPEDGPQIEIFCL